MDITFVRRGGQGGDAELLDVVQGSRRVDIVLHEGYSSTFVSSGVPGVESQHFTSLDNARASVERRLRRMADVVSLGEVEAQGFFESPDPDVPQHHPDEELEAIVSEVVAGIPGIGQRVVNHNSVVERESANPLALPAELDELCRRAEVLALEVDEAVRGLQTRDRTIDEEQDGLWESKEPADKARHQQLQRERQAVYKAISRLKTAGQGIR